MSEAGIRTMSEADAFVSVMHSVRCPPVVVPEQNRRRDCQVRAAISVSLSEATFSPIQRYLSWGHRTLGLRLPLQSLGSLAEHGPQWRHRSRRPRYQDIEGECDGSTQWLAVISYRCISNLSTRAFLNSHPTPPIPTSATRAAGSAHFSSICVSNGKDLQLLFELFSNSSNPLGLFELWNQCEEGLE